MHRNELEAYLNKYLNASAFRDYCPNGLQVEGRAEVKRIVTGVTASAALIEAAIAAQADAILVHHGYFWKGEDGRITGMRRRRIGALITHDINLFAFHLPLDAHAEVGNNVTLARRLRLAVDGTFGEQGIGFYGHVDTPLALGEFTRHVEVRLGRKPLLLGDPARNIKRVGWCTGGAQDFFEGAVSQGVDVFLSGEVSEPTTHIVRETGVAYIAAGHHATERYGVQALGAHLAEAFGIEHQFIDIDNPI